MQVLRSSKCTCSGRASVPRGTRQLTAVQVRRNASRSRTVQAKAAMQALVFDCDGVILESEDLHRRAYNATFQHFKVQCAVAPDRWLASVDSKNGYFTRGLAGVVDWDEQFYDMLQNTVGGGKPKMRWYFKRMGWPTSSILSGRVPSNEQEEALVIDTLQDWKTDKYQQMIGSGEVTPRPGVLRLMDEARAAGLKVAVCSAATKSSVVFTLKNLLGEQRFASLDCFLAGDDVDKKKPDPTIYNVAAQKLGLNPADCVVVEDSSIGLQAALGAGMRCIITYTPSTKQQAFDGADIIVHQLGDSVTVADLMERPAAVQDDRVSASRFEFAGAERIVQDVEAAGVTVKELQQRRIVQDDRVEFTITDSAILFGSPSRGSM